MDNKKIPGDYIAGFIDGEGCFALKFRRDKKIRGGTTKEYFYWRAEFAIVLREDDQEILYEIKKMLSCGSINKTKNGEQVRYSVQGIKELNDKIIPFFIKHPLRAKKRLDFNLWAEAIKILAKYRTGKINIEPGQGSFTKKEIGADDTARLNEIRDEMVRYKSDRNKDFKWGR